MRKTYFVSFRENSELIEFIKSGLVNIISTYYKEPFICVLYQEIEEVESYTLTKEEVQALLTIMTEFIDWLDDDEPTIENLIEYIDKGTSFNPDDLYQPEVARNIYLKIKHWTYET